MLRITAFEFIVRTIPETFILIFAMIILSNTKLNVRRYIISSSLLAIGEYFIRMLPINYGVPTILDIFIMIIIMRTINKTDVILAIKASLITTILLFICEGLNIFLLSIIFKDKLESIMLEPMLKTLYGFPSFICFTIITIIYYLRKRKV